MKVALKHIEADTAAQPRTLISTEKVAEYVEDMQRGDKFPPLVVFQEGEKYWLADGFHRFYAAKTAQLDTFNCDVRTGSLRDAILFSCGANASHGLRRTNDDKRRAVAKLIELYAAEGTTKGDSEIARDCHVTHPFVAKVRKEMKVFSLETVTSEKRTVPTKHGTMTTMNTAEIGRHRRAEAEDDAKQPARLAAALKEIKRQIDAMPDAEAFVSGFPADQWYFFPLTDIEAMAAWLSAVAAEWRRQARERAG